MFVNQDFVLTVLTPLYVHFLRSSSHVDACKFVKLWTFDTKRRLAKARPFKCSTFLSNIIVSVVVRQVQICNLHCKHILRIRTYTVFARSDAAATISFIARFCAATIRERRLFLLSLLDTAEVEESYPFADVE